MLYKCSDCVYETEDKNNFKRHLKAFSHARARTIPKHILYKAIDEVFDDIGNKYPMLCKLCNKTLASKSTMNRHIKTKHSNPTDFNNDIDKTYTREEVNQIIKTIQQEEEIKHLKETNDCLVKQTKELKEYINSGKIGNKTYNVSIKNYVKENYPDAPPLIASNDYSMLKFDNYDRVNKVPITKRVDSNTGYESDEDPNDVPNENDYAVATLVNRYQNKILHVYLGNYIIDTYKKMDPKDQSIWSSDASRFTYIIKQLMTNNNSSWNQDPKGVNTKKTIIYPLLDYVKDFIDTYWKEHIHVCADNVKKFIKVSEIIKHSYNIKKEIDNGSLADDIIKYIAPFFYMHPNVEIKEDTLDPDSLLEFE